MPTDVHKFLCHDGKTCPSGIGPYDSKLFSSIHLYFTENHIQNVMGLTFCSLRYFTDLKDPKNIGKIAIITKLKYAIATPSILEGTFSVAFLTVSRTLSPMSKGISVADSAIFTEFQTNFTQNHFRSRTHELYFWQKNDKCTVYLVMLVYGDIEHLGMWIRKT